MTFEKALLNRFKDGHFIRCDKGTDVHRVIYILTARGYTFSTAYGEEMANASKAIAVLKDYQKEHGVIYIYKQSGGEIPGKSNGIIGWCASCEGRRISVNEIEQSLNPNYR